MTYARFWGLASVLVVAASLVYAMAIMGTPWEARRRKADDMRVEQLHFVVHKIHRIYIKTKKLPASLSEVGGTEWGMHSPASEDPVTGGRFGYRVLSDRRYELSAVFESDHDYRGYASEGWDGPSFEKHPKGLMKLQFDASQNPRGQP